MSPYIKRFPTPPPRNKSTIKKEDIITNDLIKFLVNATDNENISWNENKPCFNYNANYKNMKLELQLNSFEDNYNVDCLKINDYIMEHKELKYLAKSIYNVNQRKSDEKNLKKETEILNKLKRGN